MFHINICRRVYTTYVNTKQNQTYTFHDVLGVVVGIEFHRLHMGCHVICKVWYESTVPSHRY